ncbi:hypothetical protein ACLKA7_010368 [Drosophila subpalustris]
MQYSKPGNLHGQNNSRYNSTEQRDLTGSNVSLGGQTGILIGEFMRLANATMKILQTSREDYCPDSTQCRIGDKIIDIGGNLVSNTSLGLYSPLVVSTKYCLVVPYERLVPLRDYVQRICANLSMITFFVFSITFEFIQEHLQQPKLTLASDPLCTVERHLRLPIQSSVLIGYIMRKFIERSTETGLTEKWMRMGLQQLKRAKMIRQHPYNPPTLRTLPLEFYTYSLKIYAMGISLSLITLLLELVYIRRINRNNVIII